ncbi:MAG: HAMP domain-containing sensor histidine kinase [Panacagrimonas sp.]
MSLRHRINLLVTGLTLLFLGAMLYRLIDDVRRQISEEIEASNKVTVQLMSTVIFSSRMVPGATSQQDVVAEFLNQLGRVRANDIRMFDRTDHLLYESPPSQYKPGRDAPVWFTHLVAPELQAIRLHAVSFYLEIIPDASRSVLDAWDDMLKLAALGAGFFLLVNGLLYAVIGRALRPVKTVVQGLARAERGDLSVRLPDYALPEFHAIGVGFNRMLERLEKNLGVERELAENRQLTHIIQEHLEEERRLLARELHDEIGQYLTAIKTIAQATANRTASSDVATFDASRTIVSSAGQIYDAMHRIIRRLRPMALERMGLADTLRDAVEEWRTLHPQLQFDLHLPDDLPRLGDEAEIALFRIAQECVTNVARHAQARTVVIALEPGNSELVLRVADDGIGIAADRLHGQGRFGLLGMRERAHALGGTLSISNRPGGGSEFSVQIPVRQASEPGPREDAL